MLQISRPRFLDTRRLQDFNLHVICAHVAQKIYAIEITKTFDEVKSACSDAHTLCIELTELCQCLEKLTIFQSVLSRR